MFFTLWVFKVACFTKYFFFQTRAKLKISKKWDRRYIYIFRCTKSGETTCVYVCPDLIMCVFISEYGETRQWMNEKRATSNGQRTTGNEERVREISKIGNLLACERNPNWGASVGANVKFRL